MKVEDDKEEQFSMGGIYEHWLWNRTDRPHSSLNHEKGFEHMSQDFQKVLRYTYSLPRSCKGHLM